MENFDDLPWNFSLRWPAWRCLDFATVLAKLGIDQLLTYASSAGGLGASLCSLPLSSTPSSTLNYKPMLAHSRTTTEQRSRMDALEQGNFATEHAAVALVVVKKKCSVSDKDVVKTRA